MMLREEPSLELHRTQSHSLQLTQGIGSSTVHTKPKLAALKHNTDNFRKRRDDLINEKRKVLKKKEQHQIAYMAGIRSILNGQKETYNDVLKNKDNISEFFSGVDLGKYVLKPASEINNSPLSELWYRALLSVKSLSCFIFKKDKSLLKHLQEVRTRALSGNTFELLFTFAPNNYFTSSNITITVEITTKGRLRRVTSSGITWTSQEYEKRFFSENSLSFFKIFRNINSRAKGLFNLRDVGRAFFFVKNILCKYFAVSALGIIVSKIEAANLRSLAFGGFDKEVDSLAQRVEQTRKDEQQRGRPI